MPVYEVFIDGKPRKIEVTKTGETAFTAKIDDKSMNVELSANNQKLEKKFTIKIDGKTYQLELPKIDHGKIFPVKVEDVTFKAEVKTPTTRSIITTFQPTPLTSTRKTAGTKQQIEEGAVTAPMTGKILSVKVKKGDKVDADQILCVLEAMKMENEITTSKAGTVREVYVSEGSSVSEGEPLFMID